MIQIREFKTKNLVGRMCTVSENFLKLTLMDTTGGAQKTGHKNVFNVFFGAKFKRKKFQVFALIHILIQKS